MMITPHELGPPWIHVRVGRRADLASTIVGGVGPIDTNSTRCVRGMKMRSQESLFDEVSAALQFPQYFGENWHAFADCLSDLAWWPADQRRLIVWDASYVLCDSKAEFSLLLDILQKVAKEWSVEDQFREACPLDVVFHTDVSEAAELRTRLDEIDVAYSWDEIHK